MSSQVPLPTNGQAPAVPVEVAEIDLIPDEPIPEKKYGPYLVSDRRPIFQYSVVRNLFLQSLPEYLVDQNEFNAHYVCFPQKILISTKIRLIYKYFWIV